MNIGFAMCGSFCTFEPAIKEMKKLSENNEIFPIMSANAYNTSTRFGKAEDIRKEIEDISGKKILHTISDTEPLGPKKIIDLLVIMPCTGNTVAKLAGGITDTSVTMAVKSSLRIYLPIVIALATNDGLGATAKNFGNLINRKNIYFVPLKQDDPLKKPTSLVADFTKLQDTIEMALEGKQIQPVFY